MRVRFSIDSEAWKRACEYAESTHRTPSELICEALAQIEARYPKRRHETEKDFDVLVSQVAAKLGLQVPAGTSA